MLNKLIDLANRLDSSGNYKSASIIDDVAKSIVLVDAAPKEIEDIYIREFGSVICPHWQYLPIEYCEICDKAAQEEITKMLRDK